MKLLFAFIFVALYGFCYAGNIPDYIHICKRNDVHVAKCIRKSIEILRPKLKEGIEELGVPAIEPLKIDEIAIFRSADNPEVRGLLQNVEVTGISDFQVTKLKLDIDKNIYRIGVKIPVLELNGDYDINARGWVVPIKSNGKFHANVTTVQGDGVLLAKIFEKEGRKQITFSNLDLALRFNDYNIRLDSLSEQDKAFIQAANEIINGNKAESIQIAIPIIEKKAADIILDIANKITQNVDYDEIFPEN